MPFDPPNILVKSADFWFAMQKMEKPVRTGMTYSGKTSQTIILHEIRALVICVKKAFEAYPKKAI